MASSLPDWVQPTSCRSRQLNPAQMMLPPAPLVDDMLSVLELLVLCAWRLDVVTAAAAVIDLAIDASSISCSGEVRDARYYVYFSHGQREMMNDMNDDDE